MLQNERHTKSKVATKAISPLPSEGGSSVVSEGVVNPEVVSSGVSLLTFDEFDNTFSLKILSLNKKSN